MILLQLTTFECVEAEPQSDEVHQRRCFTSQTTSSEMKTMSNEFPTDGRIAGIDFGTVRIGVAITDPDRILASPFENYDRRNLSLDAQYFVDLVASERIVGFIVGLPIHTDGKESQKSTEAREFGQWLGERCNLPIEFFDERYTSAFANQILASGSMTNKKKKKRLDMLAAQIMLTAYLESSKQARLDGLEPNQDISD